MKNLTPELKEAFENLMNDADAVSDGWQSTFEWNTVIKLMRAAYTLGSEKDKQLRYDYEAAFLRIQELEKQVSELRNEISGYEAEDYNRQIGEI